MTSITPQTSVFAAGPPAELWAALLSAGFVFFSLVVAVLARKAVRQPPEDGASNDDTSKD